MSQVSEQQQGEREGAATSGPQAGSETGRPDGPAGRQAPGQDSQEGGDPTAEQGGADGAQPHLSSQRPDRGQASQHGAADEVSIGESGARTSISGVDGR